MNTKLIKINKRPTLIREMATIYYNIDKKLGKENASLEDRIKYFNQTFNTPHPITGNYFWTVDMIREQLEGAKSLSIKS